MIPWNYKNENKIFMNREKNGVPYLSFSVLEETGLVLNGFSTMVFVPSLTTFVISDLLGGSKILLIGNVIEQEFTKGNNWHLGSGLSLVLMVFILISMAMIAKYDKNGEGTAF